MAVKFPSIEFLKENLRVGDLVYFLPEYKNGVSTDFYVGPAIITWIDYDQDQFNSIPNCWGNFNGVINEPAWLRQIIERSIYLGRGE